MVELNASSEKISGIVVLIDGIAFQTNILALNASVETACAGEQELGFAVVAQEVRSLAQRSADAAKQIQQLIVENNQVVEQSSALGFVRKVGSQATVDARHAYHRLKATCQLFIACGDAATFFKPAKATLYRIPLPIFGFIEPPG